MDAWLESPRLVLLAEAPGHWTLLRETLAQARVAGAQTHHARVAALCAAHGVGELWTPDREFGRYAIATRNPLTG